MDEFRVDSVQPYDARHDPGPTAISDRRKRKHHHAPAPEDEDIVMLSEQSEDAEQPPQDYYTPSEFPDEGE